ncbi:MAG: hypothetical protein HY423_13265 [Candidatus Lambdaproteobacteria bacterium]|nr:hypothetical protein [Candidatus Lambdaproteobacteria bacterium]
MFDLLGWVVQGLIYLWIGIIAIIPNAFMGGLTIGIVATVLTYLEKRRKA